MPVYDRRFDWQDAHTVSNNPVMFILHQYSWWQRKMCLLTGSKRESTSDHGPVYMEELPDRALPRKALYRGAVASLAPSAAALQASQTDVLQTQVNCLTVLSFSCMLSSICGTVWCFFCTCVVLCSAVLRCAALCSCVNPCS